MGAKLYMYDNMVNTYADVEHPLFDAEMNFTGVVHVYSVCWDWTSLSLIIFHPDCELNVRSCIVAPQMPEIVAG